MHEVYLRNRLCWGCNQCPAIYAVYYCLPTIEFRDSTFYFLCEQCQSTFRIGKNNFRSLILDEYDMYKIMNS